MLTNTRDAMLYWVGRCAAELFWIFYFQNGGRLPSWIWYDVIADHPRLVLDGPNILLKLHVDRVYILHDIAIFTRKTQRVSAVFAVATCLSLSVRRQYCV